MSRVPLGLFPGENEAANDLTGFTSRSGREYAILGLWNGYGFIEVTDPTQPRVLEYLPAPAPGSVWGDMAVLGEYGYLVKDYSGNSTGDGLVVVDLTDIDSGNVDLVGNFFPELPQAHNIQSNPESGYLYLLGASARSLIAVDVSEPTAPVVAGQWDQDEGGATVRVHDASILTYHDGPYAGREIAFCAGDYSASLYIVDVTDKSNMVTLGSVTYPNASYCHQLWIDDERQFAYVGDELDELTTEIETTLTYVIDISDLENPTYHSSFGTGLVAIDHNMSGRNGHLFQANYTSGLRVFDISDVDSIEEVGYYDTQTDQEDRLAFEGAWGVYTGLPSGMILVSDMQRGLLIFDTSEATGVEVKPWTDPYLQLFRNEPNPFQSTTSFVFALPTPGWVTLDLFDSSGRRVSRLLDQELPEGRHVESWSVDLETKPSGVYYAILKTPRGVRKQRVVRVK